MMIPKESIRKAFILWPYFLLLIVGMTVPSDGQHGLLSIKSLSFLLAVFSFGAYILIRWKLEKESLQVMLAIATYVAILLLWMMVSTWQGETTLIAQSDQFKIFMITLFFPLATYVYMRGGLLTLNTFYKTAIYSSFAYMVFKVVLVVLHAFHVIHIWTLLRLLGIQFMSMNIYGGIERMQTSVDIVTPFLLLFVLHSNRLGIALGSKFKKFYIFFSLISTFLSFSRLLLAVYFFCLCLYWFTLGPKGLQKVLATLFMVCLSIYLAIGPTTVNHIIERRFFSAETTESDDTRVKQIQAMMHEFDKFPLLGKGVGGYAPEYIKDPVILHYYEVQWVAFLMQFGLVGILLILTPLVMIALRLVNASFSRVRLSFLGLFLLWLVSGFTNPFMISLASGIMYTFFLVAADALTYQEACLKSSFSHSIDTSPK